ncbi:hypothetical protein GOL31_31680 [Sinorhizobium medicae]|nr:hypothetical protein [Sinorhizobium medicae]
MTGNTFSTLRLQPDDLSQPDFHTFVLDINDRLDAVRQDREEFYRQQREENTKWVNGSRRFLALAGAAALLLTAAAAALRFMPEEVLGRLTGLDAWVLVVALIIYAIMSAVALYEKGTDKTSSYFRHLTISIAIRDLWNKFQFAILREYPELKASADPIGARKRICELAEAFCKDLDKLTGGELADWRSEFMASLSELEETAKAGRNDVEVRLDKLVQAAAKAADAAVRAAAEAEAATKPGHLNLTIAGPSDGEVTIRIDGIVRAQGNAGKFAIEKINPGVHRLSAAAKLPAGDVQVEEMIEIKPGIQGYNIALT